MAVEYTGLGDQALIMAQVNGQRLRITAAPW